MEPENEKYKKVLNILRMSKPVLGSTEDIEREVIKKISRVHQSAIAPSDVIDFLFGWIYISWVRRSLIVASLFLVAFFVYQQGMILKEIDFLRMQTVVNNSETLTSPADEVEKLLMFYRSSGRRFPSKSVTISEQQMKELLETVNELKIKYTDLQNLIEEDPALKNYIEKKLNGGESIKTKL